MTMTQIATLKEAKAIYLTLQEDHQRYLRETAARMAEIEISLSRMRSDCDHRNPDGTSALKDMFLFTECMICGDNDAVLA